VGFADCLRWRAILGVEEGDKYELFLMTWFCLELVFDDYDTIDANAMLVGINEPCVLPNVRRRKISQRYIHKEIRKE
jgi:hypothetical protein